MKTARLPISFMLIAGEPSGDTLAAELVTALRAAIDREQAGAPASVSPVQPPMEPRFFGAGGARMVATGVELAIDLTAHAVFGLSEVVRQYWKFKAFFDQLLRLATDRQPDVIILVDYAGFNRRFAAAIKARARAGHGPFNNWRPKIVYYVSPQVWASRADRAYSLERDVDLLLSIFPFEQAWYARKTPRLAVKFIGHPMLDRFGPAALPSSTLNSQSSTTTPRQILLLPGSRTGELRRHLPMMLEAGRAIAAKLPVTFKLILPNEALAEMARPQLVTLPQASLQVGGLAEALKTADLALASSGTVTLECAFFGVPSVVLYKLSWPTYWIAKQIVQVPYIAMPNLLAGERLLPELIQADATPENLAREALDLLTNAPRRAEVKAQLARAVATLGEPGGASRAAVAILALGE